jgi:hypothetical protein
MNERMGEKEKRRRGDCNIQVVRIWQNQLMDPLNLHQLCAVN